jgi:DnaJ-class molecular chaperone
MTDVNVYKTCSQCGGDGEFPNVEIGFDGEPVEPEETYTCPKCGGSGKELIGTFELDPSVSDVVDKCNDILDKCDDILEALAE